MLYVFVNNTFFLQLYAEFAVCSFGRKFIPLTSVASYGRIHLGTQLELSEKE
jgi:hypothetical protein